MSFFKNYPIISLPKIKVVILTVLASFSWNAKLVAQVEQNDIAYYKWFDELIGIENTSLYNGIGAVEKYRVINEHHKFYKTTDFLSGSIVYDGQYYSGLEMKYDLDEDVVLLNQQSGLRIVLLQLIKNKTEQFAIDNHTFININDSLSRANGILGFHEVLLQNPRLKLLEKHTKKRFKRQGKKSLYYEFKSRNFNLLFYKDRYYTVGNRKDFIKIFPEFKKEIEAYSRKTFPKSNYRQHLIALTKRIDELLQQNVNGR
ncbi:hypothetical protein FVB32_13290 [Flagellimonas hymeniacidonis]|uniref:Uncharacterized protein n=1 Tax=Flagellimonas hymeniacidonis TaxID=2603628 RepID=A0A5C8V443_9FLAO|nr:hypothetical protein [Flagellimonas hymeniacidonis]TXN35548.1 hypothetical protein FVB32_13290 [Flagellimonas hymeniacidonis]